MHRLVQTDAGRFVTPMRYHCRLAGKSAFIDVKLPGLYIAPFRYVSHCEQLFNKPLGMVVGAPILGGMVVLTIDDCLRVAIPLASGVRA